MGGGKIMTYEEKIHAILTDCPGQGLPSSAPLLAMFLKDWRPVTPPVNSIENMTSAEIAMNFDDICPVSTKEVSAVMLYLGYQLHCGGMTGLRWSMKPAS